MNQKFKESCDRAIAEAMKLNQEAGSHKWKTVSMSSTGYWFADECEPRNMIANHTLGFYEAQIGFDYALHERFTDTPINDWMNSVSSVPEQK